MNDDDSPPCVYRCFSRLLSVLDLALGLLLCGCGARLAVLRSEAAAFPIALGVLLLSAALAGCLRGRAASAFLAVLSTLIAAVDLRFCAADVAAYLRRHREEFGEELADTLADESRFLVCAFAVHAGAEACRALFACLAVTAGEGSDKVQPLLDAPGKNESEKERESRWTKMLLKADDDRSNDKNTLSFVSDDDFAPIDEPLYTDPHWWAKSTIDADNDMSWVTGKPGRPRTGRSDESCRSR